MRLGEILDRACGFEISAGSAPSSGFVIFIPYTGRHSVLVL